MTEEQSIMLAGAVWCGEKTRNMVMDPELALEFARVLRREVNFAEGMRDSWEQTARQHLRNEEYYRGLVTDIGLLFGEKAFISDDGSRQIDVLCAKVPDLVRKALAERNR